MFERLEGAGALVSVNFDGEEMRLAEGENLAAGLLAAGIGVFRRTPVSGAPRAPYCMMGACFECLVEVDGVSVQACMVTVRPGLVVRRAATRAEAGDATL
jgi:predicted molibdopterin-dependent oxidoreductase YjgC